MLENVTSGRNSGISERLKCWQPFVRVSSRVILAVLMVSLGLMSGIAQAQSAGSSIGAYADAIKQSTIAERIIAMERYLALSSGGGLKVDALEFLVWDHMRLGHQSQSAQRARELIAISPANPIALAALNQNAPSAPRGKNTVQERVAALKSAISGLDHLNKPEGMLDRNFQMLRQQVAIMLTGAMGMSYLEIEDYPEARLALQQAVASDPNNASWVYGLALALLNGKNRDQYRGYWYLARASNLTGGTPQGQEIATYARRTYQQEGGKEEGWERFLASAAALDAPPSSASSNAGSSSVGNSSNRSLSGVPSTTTAAATSGAGAGKSATNSNEARRGGSSDSSTRTKSSASSSARTKTSSGFEATLREPASPDAARSPAVPAYRPKVIAAPSEAVSLGILIETSLLTSQNRQTIIATLKDIVRNLRTNDEACILVFSDQLDFEQDLTADDNLLEEAIGQIRPKPGKALLSGIAFAAGHLKRIGKNSNRILLVVSDGRTTQAGTDTLMFRSQVTGVRIDCLGLQASGATERALLERIAAYSGGKASFASDSGQFRTAALQMTRTMGIAVP
jgi:tetratricopeptide (TPR) repeat protein